MMNIDVFRFDGGEKPVLSLSKGRILSMLVPPKLLSVGGFIPCTLCLSRGSMLRRDSSMVPLVLPFGFGYAAL